MFRMTNIEELGADYNVADIESGEILKTVQVITQSEILEAALGPYNENFDSYSDYLEKSIAVMSGFVDLTTTLWYATSEEEVVLADVLEYAIVNGYDKVILEHLEELE